MASSSRVVPAEVTTYQVFLSFRGPDTRQGLTDAIYHALVDSGIRVFRDDDELREGEDIGGEILRAIEESKIFVPIFSKGYASSKWCLLELAKMVEVKEGAPGKKILPVFYDVDVEVVKLKEPLYREALKKHSESRKYDAVTLQQWEEALKKAAKPKGWQVKQTGLFSGLSRSSCSTLKSFAEFAKSFARLISMKLKVKHKYVTEYLVQRDDQIEALKKLLDCDSSDQVRFVGISGMGGIGKTTLAKLVFNELCGSFDGCSFLHDVRELSKQSTDIQSLQKQLLENLGIVSSEIKDVSDGRRWLREMLWKKKVLIVVDDTDDNEQLHNLVGDASWFGSGSRIIITTRDRRVLPVPRLAIQTLDVGELKDEEARRLFCMHAFHQDSPPNEYLSLSEEAVKNTGGLPLALEVISSLLGDTPHQEWADTIRRLKNVPHTNVQEKLMISFEALSPKTKQIFLDIACFFIGDDKAYPTYMWQACDLEPEVGLKDLIYKSLVKIVEEDDIDAIRVKRVTFRMHDQLRDLGREIVKRKSFEDGVTLSRLRLHDASKMLHEEEGKDHIEMLRIQHRGYTFTQKEISSLRKLRYLKCSTANFSGELTDMLPQLRWLSWRGCPGEFTGTGVFLNNLVILDLSESVIDENWGGWKHIGVKSTLKVLDLSWCQNLRKTPNLSAYSSLKTLILAHCSKLVEIDRSIGKLKGLKHLDVSWCGSLKGFPKEVCSLHELEVVLLSIERSRIQRFQMLEAIVELTSLLKLQVHNVGNVELPQSISKLERLRNLSLLGCSGLEVLPDVLCGIKSLVELDLSSTDVAVLPDKIGQFVNLEVLSLLGCWKLEKLPDSIGDMISLVKLDLSWSGITQLPDSIGNLRRLEELNASDTEIEEIHSSTFGGLTCLRALKLSDTRLRLLPPKLPTGLTDVEISSFEILQSVPEFSNLQNLVRLVLSDNIDESESSDVQAMELRGIGKLSRLLELRLDLENVTCIPEKFTSLPRLRKLTFGCPNLEYCPPFPSTLSFLSLIGHEEEYMTKLPRLTNLRNLMTLRFHEFHVREDTVGNLGVGELVSLTSLALSKCEFMKPGVLHLPANLLELSLIYCKSLEARPALSHLKKLKELEIHGESDLVEIPELGELESLQALRTGHCYSLETLPDLSSLEMLRWIDIRCCQKFRGITNICELKSLESLVIAACGCENVYTNFPGFTQEESVPLTFESSRSNWESIYKSLHFQKRRGLRPRSGPLRI